MDAASLRSTTSVDGVNYGVAPADAPPFEEIVSNGLSRLDEATWHDHLGAAVEVDDRHSARQDNMIQAGGRLRCHFQLNGELVGEPGVIVVQERDIPAPSGLDPGRSGSGAQPP